MVDVFVFACVLGSLKWHLIIPLQVSQSQNEPPLSQQLDPNCHSSEFYGIDLVPGFPTSIKPNNAHFSQHNFLATLPFPDNSLDFVHLRFMLVLLTPSQLQALLREISRVLKPLGMIEIVDVDHRIQRPGPTCQSLLNEERK